MENRVASPLLRILPLFPIALILALMAVAGSTSERPAGAAAGSCQPRTWLDWHVAVKSQCVTRTYVCHNMTAPRLLRDPRVAEAYEDAIASNDRARIVEMDVLIGQIRSAYGCGGTPGWSPPRRGGLPGGHPPIRSRPGAPDPALGLDKTI